MIFRFKTFFLQIFFSLVSTLIIGTPYFPLKNTILFNKKKFLYNFFKLHDSIQRPFWWYIRSNVSNTLNAKFNFTVRVLLSEAGDETETVWQIISEAGFLVTADSFVQEKMTSQQTLTIRLKKEILVLNNKKVNAKWMTFTPRRNSVLFINGKTYPGSCAIVWYNDAWLLINLVDFEEYIYYVLRSESWPGWPIEVNKVFAIASRSYVVAKICESYKKKCPYHIKDNNHHQTYNLYGMDENINIRRATQETRGIILVYNNQPALTMFDACCGGVIPAEVDHVDFKKAPYLARSYACDFCRMCKLYAWEHVYNLDEILDILQAKGIPIRDCNWIKVQKADKTGIVEEVIFGNKKEKHILTGNQCYTSIAKIKSFCFSISKKGRMVYISGFGFGHHVGLCQWGAKSMVDQGWDYASILHYYYPGTCLKKLYRYT